MNSNILSILRRTLTAFAVSVLLLAQLSRPSLAALDSFVYVGCSQLKYAPGSPYESAVNSILTSIVNAATFSGYNTFKFPLTASNSNSNSAVNALFQCRGDLSSDACHDCVSNAVSRLGSSCVGAAGGAMQLEGCFVRYDNATFIGVEDKTVVSDKCGPLIGDESGKDAVLAYLTAGGQYFRVGGSGKVQGMAQCVQDLSVGECQDCLTAAIQRLKSECGSAAWGDMFMAKCYARYAERGYTSKNNHNNDDEEMQKTLAIFIGLVAGVAVLIVFLSVISKFLDRKGSSGK